MKALLLEDVRKISIKEYPEPSKKDDNIITKVIEILWLKIELGTHHDG